MFEGVWVSRDRDHGFSRCIPLGEGGALAFEGSTNDAGVFVAVHVGIAETIVSLDAGGVATTVARIETEDEKPRLSALAWDGARRTLWAALPGAGLIWLDAPA